MAYSLIQTAKELIRPDLFHCCLKIRQSSVTAPQHNASTPQYNVAEYMAAAWPLWAFITSCGSIVGGIQTFINESMSYLYLLTFFQIQGFKVEKVVKINFIFLDDRNI